MNTKKPANKNQPRKCKQPSPVTQWWVIDTHSQGISELSVDAHGPFVSQDSAEQWIKNISAEDWVNFCISERAGGEPEDWSDEYIILQSVRRVKPVAPSTVEMTLVDTQTGKDHP